MNFLTDYSNSAHTITLQNGAAEGDDVLTLLTGTGRAASIADSTDWDMGSGQFTIEAYVTFASVQTDSSIVCQWDYSPGNSNNAWALYMESGNLRFRFVDSSYTIHDTSYAFTPVVGRRYHIAVDRSSGGTVRLYTDGVVRASASYPQTFNTSGNGVKIGAVEGFYGSFDFNGSMGPVRVTKGVARYHGAFTPAAFGNATTDASFASVVLLARFLWLPANERDQLLRQASPRYTVPAAVDFADITGAVTTGQIAPLAVTTALLASGAVTDAKIGTLAVTTGKIDNLAVSTAKIDNLAITTGKIADLAVDTLQIAGHAVTVSQVVSGSTPIYGVSATTGGATGTPITIITLTLTVAYAGYFLANFSCRQGSNLGEKPWSMNLKFDGTSVFTTGSGVLGGIGYAFTDSVSMAGAAFLAAGSHTIDVVWVGDPTMEIDSRTLSVVSAMK